MRQRNPERVRVWRQLIAAWTQSGHRLNPWSYLRDVLDQLADRSCGADMGDLLPDARAGRHGLAN